MNIGTYILYTLLSSIIIIRVGDLCYKNGKIYILNYFPNNINFGNSINRLLRIAYYCLNIGLTVWMLQSLKEIHTVTESISEICIRLSYILLIIGTLHFINILGVYFLHKHYKNNHQ
jgi:hypothetical protein